MTAVETLAQNLGLGALLDELRRRCGGYELVEHWQQGEFHHDLVVQVDRGAAGLPGPVLVVSTNCNGGVKEILCFGQVPARRALWHHRCPENPEFDGDLPALLGAARTLHWFDPCELLSPTARSEYKEEHRERQPGGGWRPRACGSEGEGDQVGPVKGDRR